MRRDCPLKATLEGTGDGAFAVAPDGTILTWNAAATRLLGYTEREVVGRRCCDLLDGYDDAGNRVCDPDCHIRTLARQDEPIRSFEFRTRTKAGRPLWLSMSVVALPRRNGEAPPIIHLARDVTATKELVTRLQERLAAASPSPGTPGGGSAQLTRRELEVLRLLAQGLSTARAAERLSVSRTTVRNHVQNIFSKLGVHSRLEAVAYAALHRLLP